MARLVCLPCVLNVKSHGGSEYSYLITRSKVPPQGFPRETDENSCNKTLGKNQTRLNHHCLPEVCVIRSQRAVLNFYTTYTVGPTESHIVLMKKRE